MRKRLGIFMTAALTAMVLTACTQADSGSNSAGTGNSAAAGSGTMEAAGSSGSGTVGQNGGSTDTSGSANSDAASGVSVSDAEAAVSEEAAFEGGVSMEDAEETETSVKEENLSDEQMGTLEEDPGAEDEGWTGTYLNENDETLTVSIVDSETISFSFANSGISGTAVLNGNQATYQGDDYHIVVFEYAGTDIKVSVLSEEDYDTSASPLNGVYVRQ